MIVVVKKNRNLNYLILLILFFDLVYFLCTVVVISISVCTSGVTTRGEVRQLPQGAKRQGALGGAFGRRIVCFALQNSAEFLKKERS